MLEIDLDKKVVLASVRDLVREPEDVPRPGGRVSAARAVLGIDVHRRYRMEREAAEPSFRAEVVLELVTRVDDFRVHLRGRADGILEENGGVVLEEVKSIALDRAALAETMLFEHGDAVRQARLYALCLARMHPEREVQARLQFVSILDDSRRTLDLAFDAERAEGMLERLVRARVQAARLTRVRARRRARIARHLRFPYASPRASQAHFSEQIAAGLRAGRPVLATAPTGIGKTVGALLPALRFALKQDALLFFLTAKTTQQELVARTFQDLVRAAGKSAASLRMLTLRNKRRMCPPGTLCCHPDHCPLLATFLDRGARETLLEALLEDHVHLAPDLLFERGQAVGCCPYALALALTLRVDLVVCDLNHVYAPSSLLGLFTAKPRPRETVVVVDEAHNLFDRVREHYSPFLERTRVRDVRARVTQGAFRAPAGKDDGLFADLARHLSRVDETIDVLEREALSPPIEGCRRLFGARETWEPVAEAAQRLLVRYAVYRQTHGIVGVEDDLLDLLGLEAALAEGMGGDVPELLPYVAAAEGAPRGEGVGVLCVDAARKLAERHALSLGTVAMSATIHPFAFTRDVLGFEDLDPLEVEVNSPFPPEHRLVAVVPDISTTWRDRPAACAPIARHIETVVAAHPGNHAVFFPSFAFLEAVRRELDCPGMRVLVQEARMSPAARGAVLARLGAGPRPGPVLLLGVLGGVFAEGVDLPGEGLVGVIVVGPGLPPVGFERRAMRRYFDARGRDGFRYAMLHPGMRRVVQAAGRVHRTPEDRGVIVLLGRRFATGPYLECLPPQWASGRHAGLWTGDLRPRLEAFWTRESGAKGELSTMYSPP